MVGPRLILAGLAQERRDQGRCEVLKLIDHNRKIAAFDFVDVAATHGRGLKAGNNQCSKKLRCVLAKSPLREIHDENLVVSTREREMQRCALDVIVRMIQPLEQQISKQKKLFFAP